MIADAGGGALDALAVRLRDRLLREAAEHETGATGDLTAQIRELVDREASMLGPEARAELARRVAERSFGLGPLEPLLADPEVDEVIVNGAGPGGSVWVERGGRLEATEVGFATDGELRHAIERILAPLGRRVDESEPLCDARLARRLARERRAAAAGRRRAGADDPPLPAARVHARGPRGRRHLDGEPARRPRGGGARPAEHRRQRRHRLGEDDDAQRAVGVHPAGRARGDDRGHRRAAPAAARTSCGSRPARPTSRAAARSRCAASCATRCGCGRTGSSSARSAAARRWTCSPR